MSENNSGNFFAIDRNQWPAVCELGMNAALLYLVIARGTCSKNLVSHWSANALEKYTRVARSRAKAARECLIRSKFLKTKRLGKHPIYELARSDRFDPLADFIWLPNEIVTGIANEAPAIERIRQTGDVGCLMLYIQLFQQQNLVDDCGISRHFFFQKYKREKIAESGAFDIWGFSESVLSCKSANEAVLLDADGSADSFFNRLNALISLGLVRVTPYLCEGEHADDEIIHPLGSTFDCESLDPIIENAVLRLLPEQYEAAPQFHDFVVPVLRHMSNVAVVGIGQTLHRPKTSLTAAGMAEHISKTEEYRALYEQLGLDSDVQYQGGFKVASRFAQVDLKERSKRSR